MDVEITWETTDITNKVIQYKREHSICDGIGLLTFSVPLSITPDFDTWDYIELRENDTLKGKYFIDNITKSAPDNTVTIDCQDRSKRLTDYFVADLYTVGDYDYTKDWIITILEETGIMSYTFTEPGNGARMTPKSTIGLDTAYNIITTLLQQSGWYIYFDNTGTPIIGKYTRGGSVSASFDGEDILSLERNRNDTISRNRAVVWGTYNSTFGTWVTAEATKNTSWQIDNKDWRTVLISNPYIYDYYTAGSLASTLINEFSGLLDEKTVIVHDARDVSIGDTVHVSNNVYNGNGFVTTVISEMSAKGLITTLILDERCPRLFAYYDDNNDYVYVSSDTAGVWRKLLNSDTWEDYSQGLDDLSIKDLYVRNGRFVCVGISGYAYTRTFGDNYWSKVYPGGVTFSGTELSESEIRAVACTINPNNQVKVGYNSIYGSGSWLYTDGIMEYVNVSGYGGLLVIDVDSNQNDYLLTTGGNATIWYSGSIPYNNMSWPYTNQETYGSYRYTPQPIEYTTLPTSNTKLVLTNGVDFETEEIGFGPITKYYSTPSLQRNLVCGGTNFYTDGWGMPTSGVYLDVIYPEGQGDWTIDRYGMATGYRNNSYEKPAFFVPAFGSNTVYLVQFEDCVLDFDTFNPNGSTELSAAFNHIVLDLTTGEYTATHTEMEYWPDYDGVEKFTWAGGQSGNYCYMPFTIKDGNNGYYTEVGYWKINIITGDWDKIVLDSYMPGNSIRDGMGIASFFPMMDDDFCIIVFKGVVTGSYYSDFTLTVNINFFTESHGSTELIVHQEDYGGFYDQLELSAWGWRDQPIELYLGSTSIHPTSHTYDGKYRKTFAGTVKIYFYWKSVWETPRWVYTINSDGEYNLVDVWQAEDQYDTLPWVTTADGQVYNNYGLFYQTDGVTYDSGEDQTEIVLQTYDAETLELVSENTIYAPGGGYSTIRWCPHQDASGRLFMSATQRLLAISPDLELVQVYAGLPAMDVRQGAAGYANFGHPLGDSAFDFRFINYWKTGFEYGTGANVIKHESVGSSFNKVHEGKYNKIDIAKQTPIVIYYEVPSSGLGSQLLSNIGVSHTGNQDTFNDINTTPLFSDRPLSVPVRDLRTFSLGEYTQGAVFSGYATYLGVATGDTISKLPISLSGNWTVEHDFLNPTKRFETSNLGERPYMFTTLSGVPPSGRFYQENANSSFWFSSSASYPTGNITSIRIDDRV